MGGATILVHRAIDFLGRLFGGRDQSGIALSLVGDKSRVF